MFREINIELSESNFSTVKELLKTFMTKVLSAYPNAMHELDYKKFVAGVDAANNIEDLPTLKMYHSWGVTAFERGWQTTKIDEKFIKDLVINSLTKELLPIFCPDLVEIDGKIYQKPKIYQPNADSTTKAGLLSLWHNCKQFPTHFWDLTIVANTTNTKSQNGWGRYHINGDYEEGVLLIPEYIETDFVEIDVEKTLDIDFYTEEYFGVLRIPKRTSKGTEKALKWFEGDVKSKQFKNIEKLFEI